MVRSLLARVLSTWLDEIEWCKTHTFIVWSRHITPMQIEPIFVRTEVFLTRFHRIYSCESTFHVWSGILSRLAMWWHILWWHILSRPGLHMIFPRFKFLVLDSSFGGRSLDNYFSFALLSLENVRVGSFAWYRSLRDFRMGCAARFLFGWDLLVGKVRLETSAREFSLLEPTRCMFAFVWYVLALCFDLC